jgi:hypothetical protein
MEPRALTAVFVATAVAIVVILILWVYPGYLSTRPNCPIDATSGGRTYCAESVPLVGNCQGPGFCPAPATFTFQEVSFFLVLINGSAGPVVRGDVGESNSTFYPVYLPGNPTGPPTANWTSPDHVILIEWQAPFAIVRTDGELTANVTCGVALAVLTGS